MFGGSVFGDSEGKGSVFEGFMGSGFSASGDKNLGFRGSGILGMRIGRNRGRVRPLNRALGPIPASHAANLQVA